MLPWLMIVACAPVRAPNRGVESNVVTAAADGVCVALEGPITAYTAAPIWNLAIETLARNPDRPIVILMGFSMGIIIAFEVGLVARQLGAVIFIVNGVGIAMLQSCVHSLPRLCLPAAQGRPFQPGLVRKSQRGAERDLHFRS
jgi:hypothetical protein